MSISSSGSLSRVAVYERNIGASLDRVWENVLDWEHLPWLHDGAFRSIDLREGDRDGWHADVVLADGSEAEIKLSIERLALRYTTATLAGAGAGSQIVTTLAPSGERSTQIKVEFLLPDVPPEDSETYGRFYLELYERLWDEDESMMQERQAQLDARKEVGDESAHAARNRVPMALGKVDELRAKLPVLVTWAGAEYRIVAMDGELVAHATTCPHLLGPLGECEIQDGAVTCPWHGYRFDVRDGRSSDGRKLRLKPAPRVCVDDSGSVYLEAVR